MFVSPETTLERLRDAYPRGYRKERATNVVLETSAARAEHYVQGDILVQAVVVTNGQIASIWRYTVAGGQRWVKSQSVRFQVAAHNNGTAAVYGTHCATFACLLPPFYCRNRNPQTPPRAGLRQEFSEVLPSTSTTIAWPAQIRGEIMVEICTVQSTVSSPVLLYSLRSTT